MAKYTVKNTTIMHSGKTYAEGSKIELNENEAARLADFIEIVPNQANLNKSNSNNSNKTQSSTKQTIQNNTSSNADTSKNDGSSNTESGNDGNK